MELSAQHCARTTGSDGQPQGMETAYGQADRMQVAQSLFSSMQGAGWNLRMSLRKADRIMLAFESGNRLAVISLSSQTVYSCVAEIWVSEKLPDGSSLKMCIRDRPGTVLISDGFFPFRDGVDAAMAQGVTAIGQPGGSMRDAEVIAACNEASPQVAMVFTGQRSFKH